MQTTIGRNDPCHCGSGKKYKKCHLEKDETVNRKEREKAALNAAKVAAANAENDSAKPAAKNAPSQKESWVSKVAGKVGFFRNIAQRRLPPMNKGG